MTQIEIPFFWPLTEQIDLDLDFTPCEYYEKAKWEEIAKNSVSVIPNGYLVSNGGIGLGWTIASTPTVPTFQLKPTANSAGHWNVHSPAYQIFEEKKPNWIRRMFNKYLIGWEWKDD